MLDAHAMFVHVLGRGLGVGEGARNWARGERPLVKDKT